MVTVEHIEDQLAYGEFLTAQTHVPFLQSWAWGDFQASLGREVVRLQFLLGGAVVAVCQCVRAQVPFIGSYWYAPQGPVFREAVSEVGVVESVLQELKKYFPASTFVRIEPIVNNLSVVTCNLSPTKNIQPARTLVVDLEGKGDDQLLAGMHQKTRYNIRLAQKHGVAVRGSGECVVGSPEWKSGTALIVETARRQGYKGHPGDYYENMLRFFESHAMELRASLIIAEHGGEVLASGVYIDCYGTRTYLFGGSSETNKNLMAPYALHWQAMVAARDAGLKAYDFWGLESSSGHTAGFARFKLGFGGREVVYPGAFDIVQKRASYCLYTVLRRLQKLAK